MCGRGLGKRPDLCERHREREERERASETHESARHSAEEPPEPHPRSLGWGPSLSFQHHPSIQYPTLSSHSSTHQQPPPSTTPPFCTLTHAHTYIHPFLLCAQPLNTPCPPLSNATSASIALQPHHTLSRARPFTPPIPTPSSQPSSPINAVVDTSSSQRPSCQTHPLPYSP